MNWTVLGIDLSLNHAGLVELDARGGVRWFDFITDTKGAVRKDHGVLIPKFKKDDDRQQAQLLRLVWWKDYFARLFDERVFTYVGIEDYAFRAASNTSYQIGEVGGVARVAAANQSYLRLHDPMSVKLFAAGAGDANGHDVLEAVERTYGVTFKGDKGSGGTKAEILVEEDLAAAYVVARMVWTEVLVRSGKKRLDELEEREVRVFNRCTKSNPVNLLGREFLEVA